jgi:hypothetical protein
MYKSFVGEHDTYSYTSFNRILYKNWDSGTYEDTEESNRQLVQCFTQYTKYKYKYRGCNHVTQKGIDKISHNVNPWIKLKHNGENYTIKVIENTYVNRIIGTVGFTVAEYFGSSTATDNITVEEYSVRFA